MTSWCPALAGKRWLLVALVLLVAPLRASAQPATPCAPNQGSWTVGTSAVTYYVCASDGLSWLTVGGGGASVPTGSILLIVSGTCPSGYVEETALNGKTLVGTLAANKDVGTTGGSDTITPTGVNSVPTFNGNAWSAPAIAWPAGVPTLTGTTASFSGNASTVVVNHTHGFTDLRGASTGGATTNWNISTAAADSSSTVSTLVTGNPSAGGAANYTPAGSVTITAQGTIAWPAGVPTIGAYTPAGSVTAPTFTGDSFSNRSAFTFVIFCRKT